MMLVAALVAASPAASQSPDDLAGIEIAAARRALSGSNIARSMIRVDPAFAEPRVAPGAATGSSRPAARTAAIQEAVTVPSTYRRPYGETLLLMSDPQVSGDDAQITATVFRVSQSGRRNYLTLQITLKRGERGWAVVSCDRLGGGE